MSEQIPNEQEMLQMAHADIAQLEAELAQAKMGYHPSCLSIDEARYEERQEFKKLVRYVRAYKANVEWKSDSNQAKVVVARQALSDETRKAIEAEP